MNALKILKEHTLLLLSNDRCGKSSTQAHTRATNDSAGKVAEKPDDKWNIFGNAIKWFLLLLNGRININDRKNRKQAENYKFISG